MNKTLEICENFYKSKDLAFEDFNYLMDLEDYKDLNTFARDLAVKNFGKKIYIRGLIEISTYCKNNCFYCGLRASNKHIERTRLTKDQILSKVVQANSLGIKTIVLQGGEDDFYSLDFLKDLLGEIEENYDLAITLSLGERSFEDLKALKNLGANRYLLRHETSTKDHYYKLHPRTMDFNKRIESLYKLKDLGYQTGCGMMIGSPFQTREDLYRDLQFILKLQPQMVGLGPFIPHHDTPFRDYPAGDLGDVLKILSIIRIANEKILLPATTALGSIDDRGREKGILAGCNVLMPNIGDEKLRQNYKLYDNKIGTEVENADDFLDLEDKLKKIGYEISLDRGDYKEEGNHV